jgi:hypothetical protein
VNTNYNENSQVSPQPNPSSPNDDEPDELPTGDIEGAGITEDMKDKIKATNDTPEEEASQGGERFRKLMERAREKHQQQQQQNGMSSPSPPPSYGASTPTLAQQLQMQLPPDAMNLPIEEQARLFREIMARQQMQQMNRPFLTPQPQMWQAPPPPLYATGVQTTPQWQQQQQQQQQSPAFTQAIVDPYQQQYAQMMNQLQQQQQQQMPPTDPYQQQMMPYQQHPQQPHQPGYPPPPQQQQQQHPQYAVVQQPDLYHPQTSPHSSYLAPDIGFDGRKIGRNRDADTISNTADAYLARLKRDSTTRNFARYAGDENKANAVFHDPSIADIQPPEMNPYLEERRQRERDLIETVPEEMLIFQEYNEDATKNKGNMSYSGISYKDRVAQRKARRSSNNDNDRHNNNNNGN